MKPANFPTAKNKRKLNALNFLNAKKEKTDKDKKDIQILEKRIVAPEDTRGIKTKKHRAKK